MNSNCQIYTSRTKKAIRQTKTLSHFPAVSQINQLWKTLEHDIIKSHSESQCVFFFRIQRKRKYIITVSSGKNSDENGKILNI